MRNQSDLLVRIVGDFFYKGVQQRKKFTYLPCFEIRIIKNRNTVTAVNEDTNNILCSKKAEEKVDYLGSMSVVRRKHVVPNVLEYLFYLFV